MIAEILGHYRILEKAGAGGMGEVYRAYDETLQREVAIKVLRPEDLADDAARRRIVREARTASALNHPNICTIYEVGEADGQVYIVMEYVRGKALSELARPDMPADSIIRYGIQIADALAHAHSHRIIHRDLKTANILITREGRAKLLDFGLAKRTEGEGGQIESFASGSSAMKTESGVFETTSGSTAGTLPYMAPEVLQGSIADERSDIWAFGVVLYEMATGGLPFKGHTGYELTSSIVTKEPEPLPDRIPEGLALVIERSLVKEPGQRYQQAAEVRSALEALQLRKSVQRVPTVRPRSRRLLIALLTLLVIGAAGLIVYQHRYASSSIGQNSQMQLAILVHTEPADDRTTAAFGNGLAETVTAGLAHLSVNHPLQVIPVRDLQEKGVTTLEQARQEFGVNRCLELTFHRSGEFMRASYILVDARTHRSLRADTITHPAGDPFGFEDKVVSSVASALELELGPEEARALVAPGTAQPQAYDFYLQGRGYLRDSEKRENVENAIAVFNQALQHDPKYAPALAGLGEAYWDKYALTRQREWVDLAHTACFDAIRMQGEQGEGHICLGLVYVGTGKYEDATREYEKATALDSTNERGFAGLADAYERLGKTDEAEQTYLRAIKIRPNYSAGYDALGLLYLRHGRYDDAEKMFRQAIELAPDSYPAYSNLGSLYVFEDRYSEALPFYERSAKIRPTADSYSNLGTLYFDLKRFAQATSIYEQALRLDTKNYEIWGNLADAYYWAPNMRAQAGPAYRQAIALAIERLNVNPRDGDALGYVAQYHAMLGEKAESEAYLAKALKIAPKDYEVLLSASVVYAQLGRDQEALASMANAVKAGLPRNQLRDLPNFDRLRSNPRFQKLLVQN